MTKVAPHGNLVLNERVSCHISSAGGLSPWHINDTRPRFVQRVVAAAAYNSSVVLPRYHS